jgi:hypothetical protein
VIGVGGNKKKMLWLQWKYVYIIQGYKQPIETQVQLISYTATLTLSNSESLSWSSITTWENAWLMSQIELIELRKSMMGGLPRVML